MINALLRERGSSQTLLARRLGVKPSAVSAVIYGRTKSRRIAEAIARKVARGVGELWPGRYAESELRELLRAEKPRRGAVFAVSGIGKSTT